MRNFITLLVFIATIQTVIGQTETIDVITYTAPKNWKKEIKNGVVTYSTSNAGTFCVLSIYGSTPGTDPQTDFKKEWTELVVKPYNASANPNSETQSADGWQATGGAAAIKLENVDAYAILTVFSGFGKKVSVLATLNDQSYAANIDDFLGAIKLAKPPFSSSKPVIKNPTSQTSANGSEVFGHMIFQPMKDWNMQRYANGIIFKPSALPDDRYIETRIMESRPFTGSMQEALTTSWDDALNQLKLVSLFSRSYSIIREKKSYKGWDYIQAEGTVKKTDDQRDLGYDKYYINLFIIKLNNRIERIVTVGLKNINGADYSPYNNLLYQDAIIEFCLSVKFDDWKEPVVAPLKGNTLSGLYGGFKLGGGSLNANFALFFPNGQVFFGEKFPTQGFDGKNTWVYAEQNTRNWGTYTLQNGKGTIIMGYGNLPLKLSGDNLVITTQNTEHVYGKFPSPDGAVFNGKYVFDGDWGGDPPSVSFTPDGKFIDGGALNILNHQTTDPDEFNITARRGNGRYEIKNYTLIFKYSDGREFQTVFTGNGFDRKNPGPLTLTISFNNDILYKK